MAIKKAYYYKVTLSNHTNNDISSECKNIFHDIINKFKDDSKGFRPIILSKGTMAVGGILDRVTMDVIWNDEYYLFARISKSKDNNINIIRNIKTNEIKKVLNPDETPYKTLEVYTYFLLDYSNGILSYVEGHQAPKVYELKKFIDNNKNNVVMNIENIASNETVRALLTPGSIVNRINYEFRVPKAEILLGLGLPKELIDTLTDTDLNNAKLTIKNEPYKNLSEDTNIIRRLIDAIKPVKDTGNFTIVGRTRSSSQQEYGFELKNYSSPIDIPSTKIVKGEVKSLSLEELSNEYLARMRAAYLNSKNILENLANV